MSGLKLISSPPSPFARKAKMLLLETGQDDVDVVEVMSSPTAPNPDLTAANPLSKSPRWCARMAVRFMTAGW